MAPKNVQTRGEVSYAHRSRIQKLGVKPGHRVLVTGVDDPAFMIELKQAAGQESVGSWVLGGSGAWVLVRVRVLWFGTVA